jgi:23S rRNA pseudouridine1911/1915/1917 synthase
MALQRIHQRLTLPEELAGRRFDQAAAAVLEDYSRSRLKVWIDRGELTLDGKPAEPSTTVRGGEEIELNAEIEAAVPIAPEPISLNIVHEDQAVFVIDKPAGLVVHPGAGNWSGTLQNGLLHLDPNLAGIPRAGIVHRLDKDTSGLLVIARTLAAQASLAAQLERRDVHRGYLGICQGVLTGGGTIDAPIGRHPRDRLKMAVVDRGRRAVTHYRVVARFRAHTYLRIELETGRTHQIRVHFAHQRSPLVGDPLYGGRPRFPSAPSAELKLQLQGFRRQALHATRLEFVHPDSQETVKFEIPLAEDMAALLAALRADADNEGQE